MLHHLGARADELPVLPGNDATRPGIVHRLDRDTSGLLVVAKHARAQEGLAAQFRRHDLERAYLGLLAGEPSWRTRTVDTLHGRDPADRRRFSPNVSQGRRAITHMQVEQGMGQASLVQFTLETGRTHQIRMHAAWLGHPILGDAIYGGLPPGPGSGGRAETPPWLRKRLQDIDRHALHAAVLGFVHPITGAPMRFESPLPAELAALLEDLRAFG